MEKVMEKIEKNGEAIGLTVFEGQALAKIVGQLILGVFCDDVHDAESINQIRNHLSYLIEEWGNAN